jgi:hypothetical protein
MLKREMKAVQAIHIYGKGWVSVAGGQLPAMLYRNESGEDNEDYWQYNVRV